MGAYLPAHRTMKTTDITVTFHEIFFIKTPSMYFYCTMTCPNLVIDEYYLSLYTLNRYFPTLCVSSPAWWLFIAIHGSFYKRKCNVENNNNGYHNDYNDDSCNHDYSSDSFLYIRRENSREITAGITFSNEPVDIRFKLWTMGTQKRNAQKLTFYCHYPWGVFF